MNGNGRQYNSDGRMIFGMTRSEKRANNILGVVQGPEERIRKYRSKKLKEVQDYLDGVQYNHLPTWSDCQKKDDFTPVRSRKPRIIFPFSRVYQDKVASKLIGSSSFPKFNIEDDPEAEYFSKIVMESSFFPAKMLSVAKDLVSYTSAFCRFKMVDGELVLERYCPNYCYPTFDSTGELEMVEIKYVYDTGELKKDGSQLYKWFKISLGKFSDIVYSNPDYSADSNPDFEEVQKVDHNLGFVQGEWFRFGSNEHSPDGENDPMTCTMKGFIDAFNYSLSQSDSAASYGMDPQLVIKGMTEDEVDSFIKSTSKAWLMGREGSAEHLEVGGSGITAAGVLRDELYTKSQHASRIVLLDPEKIVGSAQSGKAMEVLHGPLVELINELRPWMEKSMVNLLKKMIVTILSYTNQGFETSYTMPPGWTPKSLEFQTKWPPIFELTTQDMQQLLMLAVQGANANIVSRYSALKWLQSKGIDFGVEDLEAEQQLVATQPRFSTFF